MSNRRHAAKVTRNRDASSVGARFFCAPLFGTKKFRKKFFGEAYFGRPLFRGKKSGKKFFHNPYFRRSLFGTDFWGKNFLDKLSGLIWQKTPGPPGGGGSGGGVGEYLGAYARAQTKKPPESVVIRSEGTSLLRSSTVIEPNHPAFSRFACLITRLFSFPALTPG